MQSLRKKQKQNKNIDTQNTNKHGAQRCWNVLQMLYSSSIELHYKPNIFYLQRREELQVRKQNCHSGSDLCFVYCFIYQYILSPSQRALLSQQVNWNEYTQWRLLLRFNTYYTLLYLLYSISYWPEEQVLPNFVHYLFTDENNYYFINLFNIFP